MESSYVKRVKPIVDVIVGVLGLVFLFTPFCAIVFLVYRFGRDKGSMFFKQERIGLRGKPFYIYKFRSMVVGAEALLESDPALYQKYIANSYKLPPNEDPRLTSIGNFIRKTSIDELPQFINILKGEMSLIGPRPVVAQELSEYTQAETAELLSVKPGATGWWQVSGRSEVNYPERCELELYYPRNASFALDVKIFFLTFKNILLRIGAH